MDPNTTPVLQKSPMRVAVSGLSKQLYRSSPVPLNDYIPLSRLADELAVDVERLRPLLEHRYLRTMSERPDFAQTIVARPPKGAMDWLRTMFMPLSMRPFFPVPDISRLLGMSTDDFRYICLSDGIPIYSDPAFGELISISGFQALERGLLRMQTPARFDRQAMMLVLGNSKQTRIAGRAKPLPYRVSLEREISRVLRLPEPDRTFRATELWRAYNDAEAFTSLLDRDERAPVPLWKQKVQKRMDKLKSIAMGGPKAMERLGVATGPSTQENEPSSVA